MRNPLLTIALLSIIILLAGCGKLSNNSKKTMASGIEVDTLNAKNKVTCPPVYWTATGKELRQDRINDSTEYLYLNDSLWFTIEQDKDYDAESRIAYLKFYQKNGLLEEEGLAIYWEHPIVEYSEHGDWKHYDCKGNLIEIKRD